MQRRFSVLLAAATFTVTATFQNRMTQNESASASSLAAVKNHEDGILSHVYYGLRRIYIPTSPKLLIDSQKNLFSRFVKTPAEHKRFMLSSGEFLNYIDIQGEGQLSDGETEAPTLILTHGFASGLGFFFDNYDTFGKQFKRVVSVDWLGMGGSSRPSNAPRLPFFGNPRPAQESTDFFVDSLEELRDGLGIKNFVIAGHSLGGYLSAHYAIKYHSEELKGVLLISPAGLAPLPPAERVVPTSTLNYKLRLVHQLWERNYTPQFLARVMGRFAPGVVKSAVDRRFGSDRWESETSEAISDYLYHISALPASGEFAMNTLLTALIVSSAADPTKTRPHIYAREPLSAEHFKPIGNAKIPILILYGDNDWISFPGADQYVQSLSESGINAKLRVIRNAGHHLYMDNTDQYHREISEWISRDVVRSVAANKAKRNV